MTVATENVQIYEPFEKKYIQHELGFRDHEPNDGGHVICVPEDGNISDEGAKELLNESNEIGVFDDLCRVSGLYEL